MIIGEVLAVNEVFCDLSAAAAPAAVALEIDADAMFAAPLFCADVKRGITIEPDETCFAASLLAGPGAEMAS